MDLKLPQRLLREISEYAEKAGVRKVILFGSRARGTNAPRSDVDLAVCGGDFDDFYFSVKENIHSLLCFDIVDIENGISEELKNEIQKDGITLYEKT